MPELAYNYYKRDFHIIQIFLPVPFSVVGSYLMPVVLYPWIFLACGSFLRLPCFGSFEVYWLGML